MPNKKSKKLTTNYFMKVEFNKIIAFIRELYNNPNDIISLHEPIFKGNEKKYLSECIDSTYVSSVGKFVDSFELKMAEYTGAKHAIVCVNGTAALHMSLMLCGIQKDDEVLTQPLTFISTANAISYTGAQPVFIDVDLETMGLSPTSVQLFLEEFGDLRNDGFCYNKVTGRRISACVPMHTFGHPTKIEELVKVCDNYNIPVVEDAAESLGSKYRGKHTGTFGKLGILSFNGNKIITTGGGGMILTNDEELSLKAKHLTTQAKKNHLWEYSHDQIGYNYRMPNINAALGLAQLEQLDDFLASKREIANQYSLFFRTQSIIFISEPENAVSNYWLNSIRFKDFNEREAFLTISNENGIRTRPAWQLMNKLTMFAGCQTDSLVNASKIADTLVNLPSSVRNGN